MNRTSAKAIVTIALTCALAVPVPQSASAKVKSASTDGEATVYLTGKSDADFDVAYRALRKAGSDNKSCSTLSMLLVGSRIPGTGASVGVASDPEHPGVAPFTYVVFPNGRYDYRNQASRRATACLIELRGDPFHIYA